MEKKPVKSPAKARKNPKKAGVLIGCAAVIVLLIMFCISVVMRTNIQNDYAQARSEVGEELYMQLYMLCQTFDQVTVPGQDVENVVLPTMEDYVLAAQTLNDVMVNAFGQRYTVLTQEHQSALQKAFEAYDAAFRGGKSTADAQAAMQSCINTIRTLLQTRFNDGLILPS